MAQQAFDRIFIIMLENELRLVAEFDSYLRKLAASGVNMIAYYGVTHPSQPNYLAATSGWTCNVTSDDCADVDSTNIVDLLEAKGVTWRAYMEDMPEDDKAVCIYENLYYRKHNPFVSYNNVRNNPARLANIVNATQLQTDVQNGTLPQYCWYTPNIQNDGHTPPADFEPFNPLRHLIFAARWLEGFLPPLLSNANFMQGTLVVITFDESVPYLNNHIYTVLLGDMIKAGTEQDGNYNHYSLLRTVEENFQLGTLGRGDATANWFTFLWGEDSQAFDWANHSQTLP